MLTGSRLNVSLLRKNCRKPVKIIPLLVFVFLIMRGYAAPIADGADKFLGNITPGQYSGGIPSKFRNYWNQVTPENSGKWGMVENSRDAMNWSSLETSYNYAHDNGFLFKQHTFVWGYQEPSWISNLSATEQREEVEEWIRKYGERFPETDFIDVVNEPFNRPASYREALGGAGETGWDWIIWSFEKARQYCPKAKLLINEYDVLNNPLLLKIYLEIVTLLKERNLIDGIGIQSHCFSVQETSPDTLLSHLNQLAETGLPLYPSELDFLGDDTLQLHLYQGYFPIFWEHPAVKGITLWGWEYKKTWIDQTYLLNSSGGERPALTWLREYVGSHKSATVDAAPVARPPSIYPGTVSIENGSLRVRFDTPHVLSVCFTDLQGRVTVLRKDYRFPAGVHSVPCEPGNPTAGARIAVIAIDGTVSLRKVIIAP